MTEASLEQFTDDSQLTFEGVPVGPFRGTEKIARLVVTLG